MSRIGLARSWKPKRQPVFQQLLFSIFIRFGFGPSPLGFDLLFHIEQRAKPDKEECKPHNDCLHAVVDNLLRVLAILAALDHAPHGASIAKICSRVATGPMAGLIGFQPARSHRLADAGVVVPANEQNHDAGDGKANVRVEQPVTANAEMFDERFGHVWLGNCGEASNVEEPTRKRFS